MDVETAHAALADGQSEPWAAYAALSRTGRGVHRNPDPARYPALGSVGVYDRDAIMAVLRDPTTYSNRMFRGTVLSDHDPEDPLHRWVVQVAEQQLMFTDPPDHTILRRILAPMFSKSAIQGWTPVVREAVHTLLDGYEPGEVVEWMDLAAQVPIMVISAVIGVPVKTAHEREQLRGWSRDMAATLDPSVTGVEPGQPRDRALRGEGALLTLLKDLLDERRAAPRDDMISRMAAATDANGAPFTDEQILAQLLLLYSAGNTTTIDMLANGTELLLAHPDRLDWLSVDPAERVRTFMEEVRRYAPPIHYDARVATCDTNLGGAPIVKGDLVMLCLAAANRDRNRFDNPNRFRPDRPNAMEHLSFTPGSVHHCIGAPLARLEGQEFFQTLVERFPTMALAREPVRHHNAIATRGLGSLEVRL